MVYGTRLEHFYMVRAASSRPLRTQLSAIGSPLFLPKSKACTKLRNLRHDNGLYLRALVKQTLPEDLKDTSIDGMQLLTDVQACVQTERSLHRGCSRGLPVGGQDVH